MKYLLAVVAGILVLGALIGYSIYNKPHKDIKRADPDFTMSSADLFAQFEADEAAANQQFLDKIIQVSGKVVEVSSDEEGTTTVTLDGGGMMFGVICKLDPLSQHGRNDFETGAAVTLKGICTGMLMDVVLVRCVEI